jgi:hypothetical protein
MNEGPCHARHGRLSTDEHVRAADCARVGYVVRCHQPHALWEPPLSAPRITLDVIDPRHCAAAALAAASHSAACTPDTVVEREAFTEGLAAFKLAVARAPKMVIPSHPYPRTAKITRARACRASVSAVMVEAAGLHAVSRVARCMLSVAR